MRRKEYEKTQKTNDASSLKVGIAVSRFNTDITEPMLEGALETLQEWKVAKKNIFVMRTYGSFELPFAALKLIKKHRVNAVVAIGCIVKGETRHDEYLAHASAVGLTQVSIDAHVPIGFGVITTNNLAQARARSKGAGNKGSEAARAALEAALL